MAVLVNIPLIVSKREFYPKTIINKMRGNQPFAIKIMWNLNNLNDLVYLWFFLSVSKSVRSS